LRGARDGLGDRVQLELLDIDGWVKPEARALRNPVRLALRIVAVGTVQPVTVQPVTGQPVTGRTAAGYRGR
jgi:hypothetical protein